MIEWVEHPQISFVNESPFTKVICTKPGKVILGETLAIDFPLGWRTDVTTTPRILLPLIPQIGAHNPASLLHDRLLDLGYPRHIARQWMVLQLKELKDVSKARELLMHVGVMLLDLKKRYIK